MTYTDGEGNAHFIDFSICQENNIARLKNQPWWNEEKATFYHKMKYMGIRFALSDPPALEFYTKPHVRFEFTTYDTLYDVLDEIRAFGFRTIDGD